MNIKSHNKKSIKGNLNSIKNYGLFKKVKIDISGNNNLIEIAEGATLGNTLIYIRGNNHYIHIEKNCVIGGGELWMEDNDGSIIIREQTTIETAHLAVTEPFSVIEIKRDCMLATQIQIRTGDSHSIIDLETGGRINKAANVCLEEHVWIGANATILKGVTIGAHAIVATGSIVTKNIPSHTIAAGMPAKVIKENITWKRERT